MTSSVMKVVRNASNPTVQRQLTLEVGKLKVVIVQRQVVLHGGESAWPGGEVSNALVFTMQHLSEVICNKRLQISLKISSSGKPLLKFGIWRIIWNKLSVSLGLDASVPITDFTQTCILHSFVYFRLQQSKCCFRQSSNIDNNVYVQ